MCGTGAAPGVEFVLDVNKEFYHGSQNVLVHNVVACRIARASGITTGLR